MPEMRYGYGANEKQKKHINQKIMKTEAQLNSDILNVTMAISEKFPELSKYIIEMPVTIPDTDDPEINIKNLSDYKESLETLLKKYEKEHSSEKNKIF
jgi:predicted  nucleic acid-binding Zn-ribbon protein